MKFHFFNTFRKEDCSNIGNKCESFKACESKANCNEESQFCKSTCKTKCQSPCGKCPLKKLICKLQERAEYCPFARCTLSLGCKLKSFMCSVFDLCLKILIFPIKLGLAIFFIIIGIKLASGVINKISNCCNKNQPISSFSSSFATSSEGSSSSHSFANYKCSQTLTNDKLIVIGHCARKTFDKISNDIKSHKDCKIVSNFAENKDESKDEFTATGSCAKNIYRKSTKNNSQTAFFSIKMPNFELISVE